MDRSSSILIKGLTKGQADVLLHAAEKGHLTQFVNMRINALSKHAEPYMREMPQSAIEAFDFTSIDCKANHEVDFG